MRFRGTLILLMASLFAGALYFFYFLPRAKEEKLISELSSRFFRVDITEVEFLRIQNPNGVHNIMKQEGQWRLLGTPSLQTDSRVMQQVLEIITHGKIEKVITNDMSRTAEFGLDTPTAALFIGYKGKIDELDIGSSNPAGTGFYASARGINAVFVVDREVAEIATITLYDLRSKSLFSFDPETVTAVRIMKDDGEVELRKDTGTWRMVRPVSGRASAQDISDFLFGVLNQRADEFYDNVVPDAVSYSGTTRILLYSGEKITADIDVYYWGTGVDQGAVAYQKGMKYSGRLSRDFWNFVRRDASNFRYRNLFDFEEQQVAEIRITKESGSYTLVKKGNSWYEGDKMADEQKIADLLWFLKAWKASRLLAHPEASSPAPFAEISLADRDGRAQGNLKVYEKLKGGSEGFIGGEEQFLHYAVTDNIKDPCAVSSVDLKKIPDKGGLFQ